MPLNKETETEHKIHGSDKFGQKPQNLAFFKSFLYVFFSFFASGSTW